MVSIDLEDACADCADLCCVSFEFDAEQGFALQKAADSPCPHLKPTGGCAIHATRQQQGMSPCLSYSCHGAGQYVTQVLFQGRHWRDDPKLAPQMTAALRELAQIHSCLSLLKQAQSLPLSLEKQAELAHVSEQLTPSEGWSLEALALWPAQALKTKTHQFLRGLANDLA
ncbi:MAG: hypothetical protein JXR13_19610 [Thalassovita sp.]